mmetsp:Transcript_32260/g.30749  ORF Transcript_32260/g.30749 Transcript_32260/m.30749 type:complete len:291 (-) Transcript_32260:353-1225(-)|eukprot:CAMPEP_0119044112 /NCGR_PEP_ID=MMETSP1177-20130426/28716_1 /TAXON_ID=2985 /ORGANISM="Ochromonas sp, Strain CCMP1899" /LENGTH=290 /DNA_ID=CAMNT_0007013639 /DNA_START=194 /DNA_END=1066 /DNA_ORIENTATION=-
MMGVQGAMAEEVNNRIQKASGELVDKYASGKGGEEDRSIVDGPTGGAYKEKYRAEQRAKKLLREKNNQEGDNTHQKKRSDDSDNEDDDDGDEDIELRRIREMRLRVIKDQQREKIENVGKGHGQYREITQDEFLNEMISSKIVVCHFYHAEFARCAIIDHHIQKLVQRHVETKFVKINAEKAPFFVSKLSIRSMPTLVIFYDGIAADKIIGFEGLSDKMPEGKEDEWPTILLARLLGSKDAINREAIVDDDGIETAMKAKMEDMRRSAFVGMQTKAQMMDDEDDYDMSDV